MARKRKSKSSKSINTNKNNLSVKNIINIHTHKKSSGKSKPKYNPAPKPGYNAVNIGPPPTQITYSRPSGYDLTPFGSREIASRENTNTLHRQPINFATATNSPTRTSQVPTASPVFNSPHPQYTRPRTVIARNVQVKDDGYDTEEEINRYHQLNREKIDEAKRSREILERHIPQAFSEKKPSNDFDDFQDQEEEPFFTHKDFHDEPDPEENLTTNVERSNQEDKRRIKATDLNSDSLLILSELNSKKKITKLINHLGLEIHNLGKLNQTQTKQKLIKYFFHHPDKATEILESKYQY